MKMKLVWILVFILAFSLNYNKFGVSAGLFSRKALYTDKDDVTLVNVTTFKSTLYGKPHAWFLQFFNQWCGHCVQFSSTYIQLASIVKPWKDVISLAAIDCADTANLEVCRNYSATAFPTLKFFPTNMNDDDKGQQFTGYRAIDELKQSMIDFVSSEAARPLTSWPDLSSHRNLGESSFWELVPATMKHSAAIVEPPSSYLGREIILGTMHLRKYLHILRADLYTSRFSNVTPSKAPTILLGSRGAQLSHYVDKDNSVSGYIQFLEDFAANYTQWALEKQQPSKGNDKLHASANKNNEGQTHHDIDYNMVFLRDVENVIRYMFFQEVALHNEIKGERLNAVKAITSAMAKYLPCRKEVKGILNYMDNWLKGQTEEIKQQYFQAKLQDAQSVNEYKLTMGEWVGCRGSQPFYRGYPCGLWTTFHLLTVNHYLINGKRTNFNPQEVLGAIRSYVLNFFSCERCAKHFKQMSEKIRSEVIDAESSVLWLWQAHNKVNARLKGDETEDPLHPKQQYPSEAVCPSCRKYSDDDNNFQWDLEEVLSFLLNHYSERTVLAHDAEGIASKLPLLVDQANDEYYAPVLHSEKKRKSIAEVKVKQNEQREEETTSFLSTWGLNKTDISLCLFLYISSILLLFTCYFYILTRRRGFHLCKRRLSTFTY